MSGEGTVTIRDRQWAVSLATTPAELSQGLGGISSIPAGTGMLFDVGVDRVIEVTTEPMLFSIDIVWIHSTDGVVEVARNIEPGYLVTPTAAARYFLEVNAGEAEEVETGDPVAIDVAPATGNGGTDLSALMGMVTQIAILGLTLGLVVAPKEKPVLYGTRDELLPSTYMARGQTASISSLRKAKEVAEDIEELVRDIFFAQERVSCVPCLQYQRVETLVDPGTLTPIQQENLAAARRLAPELTGRRTEVKVAHFDQPNIIGATDGIVVYIGPHRLNKRASMLNTVAHEAAHIVTGKDDSSPVFQEKVADLTAHTLKYLQLKPEDKEQLVREYGVWAASLAEAMVPFGDVVRARAVAGRLVQGMLR